MDPPLKTDVPAQPRERQQSATRTYTGTGTYRLRGKVPAHA